jgi:predicted nucleic acid-binding Zn ribbon protein
MINRERLSNARLSLVGRKGKQAIRLGDAAAELLEQRIARCHATFAAITELWEQLLPVELSEHCRIVDVSSGRLTVMADSASYASELRWCRSELLEGLQQRCPKARIKGIKVSVG